MTTIKRTWDLLNTETRQQTIQHIIDYFHHERHETIGIIQSEKILDFFLQTIGLPIYNQAIEDAINHLKPKFDDLTIDMETLLKK